MIIKVKNTDAKPSTCELRLTVQLKGNLMPTCGWQAAGGPAKFVQIRVGACQHPQL